MKRADILIGIVIIAAVGSSVSLADRFGGSTEGKFDKGQEYPEDGFDVNVEAALVDEEAFAALATKSCQCARASDGSEAEKKDCWQEYKKTMAPFKIAAMGAACGPTSPQLDCAATDKGEKCWVSGYATEGLCTSDEARAADAAFNSTYDRVMAEQGLSGQPKWSEMSDAESDRWSEASGKADEAAFAAFNDAVSRIRNGETLAIAGKSGGCGS